MPAWTKETLDRLVTLWDEGVTTAQIGRKLGVSKNAAIGKARRLGLPARPSPINKSDVPSPYPPTRKTRDIPHLPPLPSETKSAAEAIIESITTVPTEPVPIERSAPSFRIAALIEAGAISNKPAILPPVPQVPTPPPFRRPSRSCCWPIGTPRKPDFRFCDAEIPAGTNPYCAEHSSKAYVRVRDKQMRAPSDPYANA